MSYELTCICGRTWRGQRQERAQTVPCPACGRKRFVLANSPWPSADGSPTAAEPTQDPRLRVWRLSLVVLAGGLAAMGLLFFGLKWYLRQEAGPNRLAAAVEDLGARIAEAEQALKDGNYRLAVRELKSASETAERHPDRLTRVEHQHLRQLERQAELLAHLLDDPLEEILQQAVQHRNEEEWREKFADYRGRSVLFDDVLRRDAKDRPDLASYRVRAGNVEARLALEELPLLRELPLDPPRRWLFGARLADCRREEGGQWVIHFEPDSAVLLTDEGAAASCCPGPLDDGLRAMLLRQDEWLRGR